MLFKIIRSGNDFSCAADNEASFYVGRRVPYEGNIGLYNVFKNSPLQKLNYSAQDFQTEYDFWAQFIEPTALCEGRNFLTLNTYDRAAFTFGFAQFAAHVPDGDFISFFHQLLKLPSANNYFPHLGLINDRICRIDGSTPQQLEDSATTAKLMNYLNPSLEEVEDAEVIAAAKLIHWTTKEASARSIQVGTMIETYKRLMVRADKRVTLDGRSAAVCCVICDILHQGRGGKMTWQLIDEALHGNNPLDELLEIGSHHYGERCNSLRQALSSRPDFSLKRWNRMQSSFV